MRNDNMTYLREMLEQLPTTQLDERLKEELKKDLPDDNAVRLIMQVLKEREKQDPVQHGPEIEKAWSCYLNESRKTPSRSIIKRSWILKVASIAVVLVLILGAIPQTAEAEGLFERIVRWTDSFFELLNSDDEESVDSEYMFETDNPALQQVYDAVVELGVTEPVVPMWMPGKMELKKLYVNENDNESNLVAELGDGERNAIFQINLLRSGLSSFYFKDDMSVGLYEINGREYRVVQNEDWWISVSANGNIECVISVECQEDELVKMLESIYNDGG